MSVKIQRKNFWFLNLLVLTALAMLALFFLNSQRQKNLPGPQVYGEIKDFNLVERSGSPVRLHDLKGKIWVANFIFTRCGGICPMMSAKMRQVQQRFQNFGQLRYVSFSVDPEHDTPQVLTKYAKHFTADPVRWLFLTGDKAQIFQLSQQHFHLGVSDIPLEEQEAPYQSVDHSSKFVLVDAQARIRGYYDSEDQNFLELLELDLKALEAV